MTHKIPDRAALDRATETEARQYLELAENVLDELCPDRDPSKLTASESRTAGRWLDLLDQCKIMVSNFDLEARIAKATANTGWNGHSSTEFRSFVRGAPAGSSMMVPLTGADLAAVGDLREHRDLLKGTNSAGGYTVALGSVAPLVEALVNSSPLLGGA